MSNVKYMQVNGCKVGGNAEIKGTKTELGGRRHVLLAHETIVEGHFRKIFNCHCAILLQEISVKDSTCDVS